MTPLRWWYNYFTSQRARFASAELPIGGDGYTTPLTNDDLDATWTPITTIEYCPMVVSAAHDNATELGWLETECPEAMHLLGPTEPDQVTPPNNPGYPVEDVIELWGRVYEPWRAAVSGRRLGAPAVSQAHPITTPGEWFDDFMQEIESNGYNVDFIPVHFFYKYNGGGLNTGATVGAGVPILRNYLRGIWNLYRVPLWPEISVFEASSGAASEATIASALALSVEVFRNLNREMDAQVVERWNYWPLGPWDNLPTHYITGLYALDGTITGVGTAMKAMV